MESVAPQRIGGSIGIVEGRVERTGLVAVQERLLTLGMFVLFFVSITMLFGRTLVSGCTGRRGREITRCHSHREEYHVRTGCSHLPGASEMPGNGGKGNGERSAWGYPL